MISKTPRDNDTCNAILYGVEFRTVVLVVEAIKVYFLDAPRESLHTYSGDERLSINFEQPNNWKLRIQSTERHDQGDYHCQVSSHPPIILHVSLTILGKYL
ncbi:T-lymphocyte activation antigen CD86 [Orchesella cincta]|uniref:T-lymphocyte activation antigen CD86 n=1 Tax=Orchesella cincta TaxID=48709 RepID=A0A1D2NDU3_ORCCI|nr:T-lymphocyte activation antigen CD86 [Orchesella cincta]